MCSYFQFLQFLFKSILGWNGTALTILSFFIDTTLPSYGVTVSSLQNVFLVLWYLSMGFNAKHSLVRTGIDCGMKCYISCIWYVIEAWTVYRYINCSVCSHDIAEISKPRHGHIVGVEEWCFQDSGYWSVSLWKGDKCQPYFVYLWFITG